jgi:hypothetical protein
MVIEHSRFVGNPELESKIQHNLKVAGENNYAVRLNRLQLVEGMKLWRAYDEQTWTVVRKLPNGQVWMVHDYEAEGHRPHGEIWGSRRLVRVPRGLI